MPSSYVTDLPTRHAQNPSVPDRPALQQGRFTSLPPESTIQALMEPTGMSWFSVAHRLADAGVAVIRIKGQRVRSRDPRRPARGAVPRYPGHALLRAAMQGANRDPVQPRAPGPGVREDARDAGRGVGRRDLRNCGPGADRVARLKRGKRTFPARPRRGSSPRLLGRHGWTGSQLRRVPFSDTCDRIYRHLSH